jgi:hypothetical protein
MTKKYVLGFAVKCVDRQNHHWIVIHWKFSLRHLRSFATKIYCPNCDTVVDIPTPKQLEDGFLG